MDIAETCSEDNCDEHMMYIMNNIIVPALFNNTQNRYDDMSYVIYDYDFFVKIPEYFEGKGMECKFGSEAAKIRYKYRDLFISFSVGNDNIIVDAEKRANDLFDQLDTAQEVKLSDSILCLDKATNEIENILNNKENIELIRKSIQALTDKEYLCILAHIIADSLSDELKKLYSLEPDLIESDEELYSDYIFLLLFIEKVRKAK